MPSRKRSKGKERKAKRIEASLSKRDQTWEDWFEWSQLNDKINCNHGYEIASLSSLDHPVKQLLHNLLSKREGEILPRQTLLMDDLLDSLKACPTAWKDDEYRSIVSGVIATIVTNHILHEVQYKSDFTDSIIPLCSTIIMLDSFIGGLDETFVQCSTARKIANFNGQANARRDVLKMLTRKNSCSCLKDLYSEARRMFPKAGLCKNCYQQKDRSTLMLCG